MAAIYQRARPTTFAEVVGQDHVKDVLQSALRQGRASHAYLFSGPRGVGKTTTARLLAMALNCETAGDTIPCGACESCRLVREGNHPDVMELDAASNNSVDDVRDLREKSTLGSLRGGRRVWILDEAHMLSKSAANALLKTLEEPPAGLVFVLATTEPEKLPATVLSRCQHYRFRRLSEREIEGKLERLCREAGATGEAEALALVARSADGAMRDAESLLERLLTPGANITVTAVEDALGLPPLQRIQRLGSALVAAELERVLDDATGLYRDGFAPRSIVENLTRALQDALRRDVADAPSGDGWLPAVPRRLLMLLIQVLDEEQERFIRRDDLYSLEVALIKAMNAIGGFASLPVAAGTAEPVKQASRAASGGPAPEGAVPRAGAGGSTEAAAGAPARNGPSDGARPDEAGLEPTAEAGPSSAGGAQDPRAELPPFDPVGRSSPQPVRRPKGANDRAKAAPPIPASEPAGAPDGAARAREKPAASAAQGGAPGGRSPGRFDWHAVKSAANAQLKAFLAPARETLEGDVIVISYADTHRFHHGQLVKRQDELLELVEKVAGPGYRLRIEGPGEEAPKKR